jgi:hypothetical protein
MGFENALSVDTKIDLMGFECEVVALSDTSVSCMASMGSSSRSSS